MIISGTSQHSLRDRTNEIWTLPKKNIMEITYYIQEETEVNQELKEQDSLCFKHYPLYLFLVSLFHPPTQWTNISSRREGHAHTSPHPKKKELHNINSKSIRHFFKFRNMRRKYNKFTFVWWNNNNNPRTQYSKTSKLTFVQQILSKTFTDHEDT